MTPSTDAPLTEVLPKLQAQLEELKTRQEQAQRDAQTHAARAKALERRMSTIQVATTALAGLPSLAAEQEWFDHLTAWRKTLCDELLALPPRLTTARELGRQQNLTLSILAIDRGIGIVNDTGYSLETLRLGTLMREAGYEGTPAVAGEAFDRLPWYGSIPKVERRMQQLTNGRAEAEAQLADALLDDGERGRREAAKQAGRDSLDLAPIRKTRGDGSQYDRHADGRVAEVS